MIIFNKKVWRWFLEFSYFFKFQPQTFKVHYKAVGRRSGKIARNNQKLSFKVFIFTAGIWQNRSCCYYFILHLTSLLKLLYFNVGVIDNWFFLKAWSKYRSYIHHIPLFELYRTELIICKVNLSTCINRKEKCFKKKQKMFFPNTL